MPRYQLDVSECRGGKRCSGWALESQPFSSVPVHESHLAQEPQGGYAPPRPLGGEWKTSGIVTLIHAQELPGRSGCSWAAGGPIHLLISPTVLPPHICSSNWRTLPLQFIGIRSCRSGSKLGLGGASDSEGVTKHLIWTDHFAQILLYQSHSSSK